MHKVKFFGTLSVIILSFYSFKSAHSQDINHWEMVVSANDSWQYFPGNSEPPAEWPNTDFDASTWLTGTGGIGYGDGDDGTIISPVLSVFLRTTFSLTDTSIISWAVLNVDYDDAFVAYLNGHEIARANIGEYGIRPSYNMGATDQHEAQMYTGGAPDRYIIHRDTLKKYMIEGGNVLALQVHNTDLNSSDLSSNTFLFVGIEDASTTYREVPSWFTDPLTEKTNLPILLINTNGATIVDEPKITANLCVIDNGPGNLNSFLDSPTDYDGNIGIELRGQSSQMFPKKGYSMEIRNEIGEGIDTSLLGMPAEEDWVLYAPYSDKSLLRNAITYHLGRKMGRWQPRFKFCEVYLNNSYQGVYMLIEKIKRDANRLDISKLDPDEITGNDLTGGYIVKVDKTWDLSPDEYFYTYPTNTYNNARNYAFSYVYPKPEDIVEQQKSYIQSYLLQFENTLNGSNFKDPVTGYQSYIDVLSFVDFQIINELSNNVDGYRYSCFFYKEKDSKGGKLFAGPLWDFNLGYGNVDYSPINLATDQWLYPHYGATEEFPMHWWARLMEDDYYVATLSSRWNLLRQGSLHTDSIMDNLSDTVGYLGDAIGRNFEKWPVLGVYVWPNYFVGATFDQELNYLKTWINDRLEWMDANITSPTKVPFLVNKKTNISVFPNPVVSSLNVQFFTEKTDEISIEIIDLLGKEVFRSKYQPLNSGIQSISADKPHVKQGYYILRLKQNDQIIAAKKLIIKD